MRFRTRFLAVLLIVQAVLLWRLAHRPLTPMGLVGWAIALHTLGWQLYSLYELATSPHEPHNLDRSR
jgi:hypothetical protein